MTRKGKSQNSDSVGSVHDAPKIHKTKKIIFKQEKKKQIDTFSAPTTTKCFPVVLLLKQPQESQFDPNIVKKLKKVKHLVVLMSRQFLLLADLVLLVRGDAYR